MIPPSMLRGISTALMLLGCALLPSCTLITDVDREDIPEPPQVLFPEADAGEADAAAPPEPDVSVPADAGDGGDASPPALPTSDAGGDAGDAGTDAGI